jgi:hypothetical protein
MSIFKKKRIGILKLFRQGGVGSGHHGHRGRPGMIGGSSSGSGGAQAHPSPSPVLDDTADDFLMEAEGTIWDRARQLEEKDKILFEVHTKGIDKARSSKQSAHRSLTSLGYKKGPTTGKQLLGGDQQETTTVYTSESGSKANLVQLVNSGAWHETWTTVEFPFDDDK